MIAEAGVASIATEQDRLVWGHELDEGYRGLVQCLLDRGEVWPALDVWQWYRAIASRLTPEMRTQIPDPASPGQSDLNVPPDWSRTLARSVHRGTILTFVQLADGIAAWTYDDRGAFYRWIPLTKPAASALANRFLGACATPSSSPTELRDAGWEIYRAFLSPLLGHFVVDRVLVVDADGPLARVPFRALQGRGAYFGDEYQIVLSSGIQSYGEDVAGFSQARGKVVAVGSPLLNPAQASIFPPLPDAEAEAAKVAGLFPDSTFLTGQGATVAAVEAGLRGALIFHFAGHALSSNGQTGLILASSREPAANENSLWKMNTLGPGSLTQCRLVVLSACATNPLAEWGVSDPDSLARLLLSAGVRHVVASRWTVDSRATRLLMERFYGALKTGHTVADALRSASGGVRALPGMSHPYYWAAFEAFGNT
jgi:hypothetical protein